MGSYLFSWTHPASEVHVTGTFDDWTKSVKLEKKGDGFEKLVNLPSADEKVYYKFYVDDEWKLDHTVPQEEDGNNNLNNVLTPDHITKRPATMSSAAPGSTTAALAGAVPLESKKSTSQAGAAAISSVSPNSTTAGLAKDVPLEKNAGTSMPGDFPETPQQEPAAFSVNPIPATEGAGNPVTLKPGEKVPDPSTLTKNTVSSTAKDDSELAKKDEGAKSFGVNPIPATAGAGNPVHLEPGEKVPDPSSLTKNTVTSTVKDDPELVKKSQGAQSFGVSPLPATAGAGNPIHLEPGEKVPDPSTFTSNTTTSTATTDKESHEKGPSTVAAGSGPSIAAASGAFGVLPVVGSGATSQDKAPVTVSSAAPQSTTAGLAGAVPLESKEPASTVPEVVKESQAEVKADPEASASKEMVQEKSAMESELQKKVSPVPASSDTPSADKNKGIAAAAGGAAVAAGGTVAAATYSAKDKVTGTSSHVDGVPSTVEKSIETAHQSPEAAANKEAVAEKKAVETELLKEVKTTDATGESAPSAAAATSETAPQATKPRIDSRDISPMSRPQGETSTLPPATTSAAAPSTPAKSVATTEAPSSSQSSATATQDKKKNRRSFFGKIKEKLKNHDK